MASVSAHNSPDSNECRKGSASDAACDSAEFSARACRLLEVALWQSSGTAVTGSLQTSIAVAEGLPEDGSW